MIERQDTVAPIKIMKSETAKKNYSKRTIPKIGRIVYYFKKMISTHQQKKNNKIAP